MSEKLLGMVELDAKVVEKEARDAIDTIMRYRRKRDEKAIQQEIEYAAKRRWWDILPGKVIDQEEAIRRLDGDRSYFRGWRSREGEFVLNAAQSLLQAALTAIDTQGEHATMFLSDTAIKAIVGKTRYKTLDWELITK